MTKLSPKQIAVQRVLDSAMQWAYQLSLAGPEGDFQKYKLSCKRLQNACARLKKVSR